jgi:hypothetical protein
MRLRRDMVSVGAGADRLRVSVEATGLCPSMR